jgi:cytochrome c oxidase subunit 4
MVCTDMAQHVVPTRTYYLIFGALLFLTYLTVQISFFDLGSLNTIAALAIAALKATLVVLFFMHVKYSTRLTKLAVVGGLYWMLILLSLTLSDYLTRGWRTYG